jgi:hypothetical protein
LHPTYYCYVFPPFALLLPVIAFIRENSLNCTLIACVDGVAPTWIPNLFNHIDDAFVVGNKGEKGILKYPTKKGYLDDKFGLPGNLWVNCMPHATSKLFLDFVPNAGMQSCIRLI